MLDIKLPQAVELGFKLLRTEILAWLADECPVLCLRLLFITSIFLGIGLCAVFLFVQAHSFTSMFLVFFKMGFLCGATFFIYSILFDWIRPITAKRNTLPQSVRVLPPLLPKTDMDADKNFKRVKDAESLRDGDIICLEFLEGSQRKEKRQFLCISKQRTTETHSYGLTKFVGHKIVLDPVTEWVENPREWKRFCFQVTFDNNRIVLKSIETDTYLFMMGVIRKLLVSWSETSSVIHRNPSSWERWALHPHVDSETSRHMMFRLYYCFDSKYLKYVPEHKCFEISKQPHKAARLALWKPIFVDERELETKQGPPAQ